MIQLLLAVALLAPAPVTGFHRADVAPASQPSSSMEAIRAAARNVYIEDEAGEIVATYRLPIPEGASCLTLVVEDADGTEREEHFTIGEDRRWVDLLLADGTSEPVEIITDYDQPVLVLDTPEPVKPACGECKNGDECRVQHEPNCCVSTRERCTKCKVCAKRPVVEEP